MTEFYKFMQFYSVLYGLLPNFTQGVWYRVYSTHNFNLTIPE